MKQRAGDIEGGNYKWPETQRVRDIEGGRHRGWETYRVADKREIRKERRRKRREEEETEGENVADLKHHSFQHMFPMSGLGSSHRVIN